MKRVLIGILLTVVFYFVGCALLGGVAGGIAGANAPQNASAAGARAGAEAVMKYRAYVFVAALTFGALGSWRGQRTTDERELASGVGYQPPSAPNWM